MVALFTDEFLKSQVAMRGGTLLHKVHLAPPSRYSGDIDLVVIGDRPENHIHKAIRRVLLDVLGKPNASLWDSVKLGVRNAVKPSRVLRMTYRVPSISMSGRTLERRSAGIDSDAGASCREAFPLTSGRSSP